MPLLHGNNFQLPSPTVSLNGNSSLLGTTTRPLGEHIEQYVNVPSTEKPTTVTITASSDYVVHYTYGPQYPTAKVDNVSCFKYTTPFVVTNNKEQDGTTLFIVAFEKDADGNAELNEQSNVVIAKFKINK